MILVTGGSGFLGGAIARRLVATGEAVRALQRHDSPALQELGVGESGEIITHGPEVFEGYWKRPDATAAAFIEFEGKRFFRTGDMGRVDEDGYFFMTDRLKRMINASGFKVWPAEVELLMFRNPAIQHDACSNNLRGIRRDLQSALKRSTSERKRLRDVIGWAFQFFVANSV